jgi:hypothetical protein
MFFDKRIFDGVVWFYRTPPACGDNLGDLSPSPACLLGPVGGRCRRRWIHPSVMQADGSLSVSL